MAGVLADADVSGGSDPQTWSGVWFRAAGTYSVRAPDHAAIVESSEVAGVLADADVSGGSDPQIWSGVWFRAAGTYSVPGGQQI